MARKTKEETEKTFHALLDSATKLFSSKGVSATTLNEIANNAGMTRGAVYWHFPNKEAVITALWERDAAGFQQAMLDQIMAMDTATEPEQFLNFLSAKLQEVLTTPELNQAFRIVMSSLEFTADASTLQLFLQEKKSDMFNAFKYALSLLQGSGALRQDLEVDLLAGSLLVYISGMLHTHMDIDAQIFDVHTHSETLIQIWLDAVRAK